MTQICPPRQLPPLASISELEAMSFSHAPFWPPIQQQQTLRELPQENMENQAQSNWYQPYEVGFHSSGSFGGA